MHWSEVWHSKRLGPTLARAALTPLSWLYAGGWETYLAVYRLGLKKSREPHRPVVCVGNLLAGGSGKSPTTLYLAGLIREMGRDVVIGCSGYGSPRSESATLAPDGPLDPGEWGDEPSMMRLLAPGIPLIVGRNRVQAAKICHEKFSRAVLLMDDGFQHLPLKKHLTILLDPRADNSRCVPAGPYREPRRHRKRADLVLPNGFKLHLNLVGFSTRQGASVALAGGSKVQALCALGDPSRFFRDLEERGLVVTQSKALPDHDDLQMGNLFESLRPELPVIVTAKDWVKLQRRSDLGSRQLLIARQQARIEPEAEFKAWLTQKLNELSNERPTP